MKRSELVKQLVGTYVNKENRYEINEEFAELILNFLEMKGMAPPEVEGAYFDGRLLQRFWESEE